MVSASVVFTGMAGLMAMLWTGTLHEVPQLLTRLRNDIPPGEYRNDAEYRAASRSAIALACWLRNLTVQSSSVNSRVADGGDGDYANHEKTRQSAVENTNTFLKGCRIFFKAQEDADWKREYETLNQGRDGRPDL